MNEEHREFVEALDFEEWLEASRARASRPCPACGMPIVDPDINCCNDCLEEEDGAGTTV